MFVGAYASNMSINTIFILGMATLIADAIAMALGDYLSTKSENEYN